MCYEEIYIVFNIAPAGLFECLDVNDIWELFLTQRYYIASDDKYNFVWTTFNAFKSTKSPFIFTVYKKAVVYCQTLADKILAGLHLSQTH